MTEALRGALDASRVVPVRPQEQNAPLTPPTQEEHQPDPAGTSGLSALTRRIEKMEKHEERMTLTTRLGLNHLQTQPFTKCILTAPLPEHFRQPKLDAYDRLSNPDVHLQWYVSTMASPEQTTQPLLCL